MGGVDKSLVVLEGRTLLERVVDRLRAAGLRSRAQRQWRPVRFSALRLTVVPDETGDRAGPLAGILAALDHAAALPQPLEWVVSAPCDTPFLPSDLVDRLHAARLAASASGAFAIAGSRRHPATALWAVARRGEMRSALSDGLRRVDAWPSASPWRRRLGRPSRSIPS